MIALYRKYRPKFFRELVGQEQVKTTLQNAIKHNRIVQTYLFCGPRGTGKTTTARIFAKALNCPNRDPKTAEPCGKCEVCESIDKGTHLDLIEIDAASNRKIDNIRELNENIKFLPSRTNHHKIYIIDESHMLTKEASNAFLKNLEEPPKNVVFILATTNPEKMLPTILSRVQRLDFFSISATHLRQKLDYIIKQEKISIDSENLDMIVMQAMGGARDAESILGKLITFSKGEIKKDLIESILGKNPFWESYRFLESLSQKNSLQSLTNLHQIYNEGYNLNEFTKILITNTRKILLFQVSPSLLPQDSLLESELKIIENLSTQFSSQDIQNIITIFSDQLTKINGAITPILPLEMATLQTLAPHTSSIDRQISTPQSISAPFVQTSTPKSTPSNTNHSTTSPSSENKKPSVQKESGPEKSLREMLSIGETGLNKQTSSDNTITLDIILKEKNSWLNVIKKENHTIALQLNNAQFENFTHNTLVILVESDFHRGRLEKYTSKIEQILSDFYKQNLKVQFIKDANTQNNPKSNAQENKSLNTQDIPVLLTDDDQPNNLENDINEVFKEFL